MFICDNNGHIYRLLKIAQRMKTCDLSDRIPGINMTEG
ncbi:hypothetical protein A225_3583 [Klebsiella michiganensis E718]|nr:hypothetical protein A225_3583 [Klebsiella michiganensis E718]